MVEISNTINEVESNNYYQFREFLSIDAIQQEVGTKLIVGLNSDYDDEDLTDELDPEFLDDFSGDVTFNKGSYSEIKITQDDLDKIKKVVDKNPASVITLSNTYIAENKLENHEISMYNPSMKKKVIKPATIHRDDLVPYCKVDNSTTKRILSIDYALLFNRPELEDTISELFIYNLDQKAYQSILDKIVNDINFILNEYPELGLKLLRCRTRAFTEQGKYDDKEFILDIIDIVNDNRLRSIIHSMIESTYEISLDSVSANSTKKIIEDLQLTDKSNKVLLENAILDRLILPLISQYCKDTESYFDLSSDQSKYRFNNIVLILFNYINRFIGNERGVNINSKLFKIIEPRVKSTNYSNRVIWRFLENYTFDDETAINKFINKIIRQIVPKLDTNKSAISFLDVVIRKMIDCDFRFKYLYSYKTININSTDDDDINELDKVALTHYHKNNEMLDIIIASSIKQFIDKNIDKYDITKDNIENLKGNIKALNEFQLNILNIYYSRHFPLNNYPMEQTLYLLTILSKIMEESNMVNLSKIILGKINSGHESRSSGRISADITKSASYQEIRKNYSTIIDKFDKDAFLLKLSSVYNFDFIYYDLDGNDHELNNIDRKEISSEIFEFALMTM